MFAQQIAQPAFLPTPGAQLQPLRLAQRRQTSIVTEAHHYSCIVYAIPLARAKALLPAALAANGHRLAQSELAHRPVAWLSVVSYLDQNYGCQSGAPFEQTAYRLHLQSGALLLDIAVGSLLAVGARQLWSMPWQLAAMELQFDYDEAASRYRSYRWQTQSARLNACWELEDGGVPLDESALPAFLTQPATNEYFLRRDRRLGLRRVSGNCFEKTAGVLRQGRCDLLQGHGWLTSAELAQPALVWFSRAVSLELAVPAALIFSAANQPFTAGAISQRAKETLWI
jgi:hypothetical protein